MEMTMNTGVERVETRTREGVRLRVERGGPPRVYRCTATATATATATGDRSGPPVGRDL